MSYTEFEQAKETVVAALRKELSKLRSEFDDIDYVLIGTEEKQKEKERLVPNIEE